jgi:hypothetical protein
MSLADLIERLQGNLPMVGIIAAAVYYFWPNIKTAFAGGFPATGSKTTDEFLSTVDSARDLIQHLDAAGDTEGADAARRAAARLFEKEAKAK